MGKKGMMSRGRLIDSYKIQPVIFNNCTIFQNSTCCGSQEICDTKLIGQKERMDRQRE